MAGTRKAEESRRGSSESHRAQWRAMYEESKYDELPWFDPEPSACVKLVVREGFFPKGGDVLDIGCGAGSNVLFLAKKGFKAHGRDISPGAVAAALERAREADLEVDVGEGDALALSFKDESLDGVVDHGCFHTLPIPRRADYAREVHRVLRPGGKYLLAWVAREATGPMGPPHRPSLNEVTGVLESSFLFLRSEFQSASEETGPASYFAFLSRRSEPYPPPI